ncbi:ribonuclease-like [Carettochelys insculpta]|uniref:ribonuclease-like n=1 Tax=Carettochelys insculpta TaxID=44489 RepID=UPI003EB7CAD2
MAPRGTQMALLLLLLAACLALALALAPASGQPWYELSCLFNKNHVSYPRSPAPNANIYGTQMVQSQGIYLHLVNTFVHEPISKINNVCSEGGIPVKVGLRESNATFNVTKCVFQPSPWSISYLGKEETQKVTIGCWNGVPVYLLKEI